METQRQKKIAGVLQKDLADVLQRSATEGGWPGILVSVSKVAVTTDLSIAKVHLSIFPAEHAPEIMESVQAQQAVIRHELARRTRHQLRRMPELSFYLDDSLDYIDKIEKSLEGGENPIENRNLLERRKKS